MRNKREKKLYECPQCGRDFYPNFRNGLKVSRYCLSCTNKKKRKPSESAKIINLADQYFSRWLRLKYSYKKEGKYYCTCMTCGKECPIKSIDNGHFISREHFGTRYHEDNCRPQCKHCNSYKQGRHLEFEIALIKEIGEGKVAALKQLAIKGLNCSKRNFVRTQKNKYQKKLLALTKQKGNPWGR